VLIILARGLFAVGYKCGLEQCDHISRWEEEASEALAAEVKRREEAVLLGAKQAREFDAVFEALGMLHESIPMSAVISRVEALLTAESERDTLRADNARLLGELEWLVETRDIGWFDGSNENAGEELFHTRGKALRDARATLAQKPEGGA
jgi:hypothetical protein